MECECGEVKDDGDEYCPDCSKQSEEEFIYDLHKLEKPKNSSKLVELLNDWVIIPDIFVKERTNAIKSQEVCEDSCDEQE